MEIRVHKYGGTCMGSSESRQSMVAGIRRLVEQGVRVLAVVSAMGRRGSPYATDSLLDLLGEIREDVPPRELDLLLGVGEILSVVRFTGELRRAGVDAVGRTGPELGILTDGCHGSARIQALPAAPLRDLLSRHQVVVAAGFQGQGPDGALTTLGRGGSDLTAVALAAALELDEVWIYTDVEGVFTADPRAVPTARLIREMNAADVSQMAWQGARVLHPRAAEMAGRHDLEVRVRRVEGEDETRILPEPGVRECRHVTAVVSDGPVTLLEVEIPDGKGSTETAAEIFSAVADAGISADMIGIGRRRIRFNVPQERGDEAVAILRERGLPVQGTPDCARVSIVGAAIHGVPGIMARFCQALLGADVAILQTVDSHATISALVPGQDRRGAEAALHRQFVEEAGTCLEG